MLPPTCRNPACMNIEVMIVSHGHGTPYNATTPDSWNTFLGTNPSAKISARDCRSSNVICQKKTATQAAISAQVMKGVSRVGFSSEMGIIQGEFAGAAGRRCNLYSTG